MSFNVVAKEVCLKHKSLGVSLFYNLDLRFVEVENGVQYAYFIDNINLPEHAQRYHRVKCNATGFKYQHCNIKFADLRLENVPQLRRDSPPAIKQ